MGENGNLKISHFLVILGIVVTISVAVTVGIINAGAHESQCRVDTDNKLMEADKALHNEHEADYRKLHDEIGEVKQITTKIATKLNVDLR